MFENLNLILQFDPMLVAAFAGFTMLVIQTLKSVFPWAEQHPLVINLGTTLTLATLVALNVTVVLEIILIAFLIMSSASGVYSASKKETTVDIPDYTDSH